VRTGRALSLSCPKKATHMARAALDQSGAIGAVKGFVNGQSRPMAARPQCFSLTTALWAHRYSSLAASLKQTPCSTTPHHNDWKRQMCSQVTSACMRQYRPLHWGCRSALVCYLATAGCRELWAGTLGLGATSRSSGNSHNAIAPRCLGTAGTCVA
jgi:hypothetical protein